MEYTIKIQQSNVDVLNQTQNSLFEVMELNPDFNFNLYNYGKVINVVDKKDNGLVKEITRNNYIFQNNYKSEYIHCLNIKVSAGIFMYDFATITPLFINKKDNRVVTDFNFVEEMELLVYFDVADYIPINTQLFVNQIYSNIYFNYFTKKQADVLDVEIVFDFIKCATIRFDNTDVTFLDFSKFGFDDFSAISLVNCFDNKSIDDVDDLLMQFVSMNIDGCSLNLNSENGLNPLNITSLYSYGVLVGRGWAIFL
jgi:hypothetical protein